MKKVTTEYLCDVCGMPAEYVLRLLKRLDEGAGAPLTVDIEDLCSHHAGSHYPTAVREEKQEYR